MSRRAGPLVVALAAGGGVSAMAWLALTSASASGISARPATCLATHCFCESVADAGVRQPVNTASSFAFVLAGCWILASAATRRPPHARTPWRLALGCGGVLTGLGSAAYHALLTFDAQFFDVLGMHVIAGVLLAHALARAAAPPRWRAAWFGFALYLPAVSAVLWFLPDTRRWLFAALIAAGLGAEGWLVHGGRGYRPRWLIAALVTFVAAFGVWALDETLVLCTPTSVIQGHGAWHVLGAAALLALDRYVAEPTRS